MDALTDRAHGLMVGLAVGNLLGVRYEGWSREKIEAARPDGISEITAQHGYPDDDDLAQAILLAEAAAEGRLAVDDLGRRFWEWGELNGAGMGGLTRTVLTNYGGSEPWRLARNRRAGGVREPQGQDILSASKTAWAGKQAGNGALMRCAPLAIRWHGDDAALVRESIVSAVPTHWDPSCGWSCVVQNLCTASALRGKPAEPEQIIEQAEAGVRASLAELSRYDYEPIMHRGVRRVTEAALTTSLAELDITQKSPGFTLTALEASLSAYADADDFETGLRVVVEQGGDTDTNGAVAGALLGARFGLSGIPERWRRSVNQLRRGRISMESYADALLQGSA